MQQEQDCTSIGKNIVFTSFTKDYILRGLPDCEWRRLVLLLSPRVRRTSRPHLGPKTCPEVARLQVAKKKPPRIIFTPPRRKFPLYIPHAAQRKNSLRISLRRPEEKISPLHATHQMPSIVNLYRTPHDAQEDTGFWLLI